MVEATGEPAPAPSKHQAWALTSDLKGGMILTNSGLTKNTLGSFRGSKIIDQKSGFFPDLSVPRTSAVFESSCSWITSRPSKAMVCLIWSIDKNFFHWIFIAPERTYRPSGKAKTKEAKSLEFKISFQREIASVVETGGFKNSKTTRSERPGIWPVFLRPNLDWTLDSFSGPHS